MFKNYTNCIQMTSGFTFVVACSVPEYVHSKPNSTHSGDKGGEKRREGRLMILSSQGMGPFTNDVVNFFSDFSYTLHHIGSFSVLSIGNFDQFLKTSPSQLPTSLMDGPSDVVDEDGKGN